MVKEHLGGKMGENTLENIIKIRKKGLEYLSGRMALFIRVNGRKENNMGKDNLKILMEL